MITSIFCLGFG